MLLYIHSLLIMFIVDGSDVFWGGGGRGWRTTANFDLYSTLSSLQ